MAQDLAAQPDGATARPTAPLPEPESIEHVRSATGPGWRLAELTILLLATVGAVALGLGISDYLSEHVYVQGYLLGYAGFRIAGAILVTDAEAGSDRSPGMPRWWRESPVLILFAAAPFERTYVYGGAAPDGVAAVGLLMELAGLWLAIGARIQLRIGGDLRSRGVVRSGFYRYVRHPVRAGTGLVLLAWPFEYGAPVIAAITLALFLLVAGREISREESEMLARFGDEYGSYMHQTDRLIPNLW
jgi:protein-S-isoprenylcysteine O-methyltransferase Ste14